MHLLILLKVYYHCKIETYVFIKTENQSLFLFFSYLAKPNEALSCFNKCRRDKQYGRQAIYIMVKIVLNPDNEIIAGEDDWKRLRQG